MNDIEKIYQDLTNVNLDEQQRIGDERSIGYQGEFNVFNTLYQNIESDCKFLMNLHIPTSTGRSTEIDLLMIHETGIYVFEVKHYKGTIYGNTEDNVWTQFFRTSSNHTFENPVYQNGYHIRALKLLFPDVPIHSIIVFSNPECVLKVQNNNPHIIITPLDQMIFKLNPTLKNPRKALDSNAIDNVFSRLKEYSPLREANVDSNNHSIPFYDFLHSCLDGFKSYKAELAQKNGDERIKLQNAQKAADKSRAQADTELALCKKQKHIFVVALCIVLVIALGINCYFCIQYKRSCDQEVLSIEESCAQEINAMEKNFKHVDLYNDGNIQLLHNFIDITDVKLEKSKDLQDTVVFGCTISNNGEEYGIMLNKDTKYIILTSDGKSHEYDMFGERLPYYESTNMIAGSVGKGYVKQSGVLKDLEIYGIQSTSDISYIKLTNVSIWKWGENNNHAIVKGLELELYSVA